MTTSSQRRFFQEAGRKGGLKRSRRLSAATRTHIASQAAKARWKKQEDDTSLASIRFDDPQLESPAFLEELLSEGSWREWRVLHEAIKERPFGTVALSLGNVLASTKIYGVTHLWKNFLKREQGI
ncbi:MAG: hypothetical protein HY540_00270 [Deltaproteobacteria bacterium]|nr:hypothetical protein [Deltaproteobacteria bacterium]